MAKSTFRNHKKLIRLQYALGLTHGRAYGLITYLWDWAQEHCTNGLLSRLDLKDALVTVGGHIEEAKFDECLLAMTSEDHQWLDQVGDRYYIHDWHEHCENSVHAKLYRSLTPFGNGAIPKPSGGITREDREALEAKWAQLVADRENECSTSCQLVGNESPTSREQDLTSCQLPLPKPKPIPKPSNNYKQEENTSLGDFSEKSSPPPDPVLELVEGDVGSEPAQSPPEEPRWWSEPPEEWLELDDGTLPARIAQTIVDTRLKTGKKPFSVPKEAQCRKLAKDGFCDAPDADSVQVFLRSWLEWHSTSRKARNDPILTMRRWLAKEQVHWKNHQAATLRLSRAQAPPKQGGSIGRLDAAIQAIQQLNSGDVPALGVNAGG